MIYNKKNYWYKKNNNDLLSLNGQQEIIKKYAKGFGSSVYNYTTDLNNIYQTLSYNYRFNIVPKKDISLFGNTYNANTVYNITKNVKVEDILASNELRKSIRNGEVVAMDARMDNNDISNVLLDTVCYKENLYSNKNFQQVIITISNPQGVSFGTGMEIFLNTPQYNIDGILSSPNTNIRLGSVPNHIVATNQNTNKIIAKYIYDADTNQAQYYIEYTELAGIADSFLSNIYTTYLRENLYKIEAFYGATITTSNDNKRFVSDISPIYTNYTTRIGFFSEQALSLILADSQLYVSKNIVTYNFNDITKNTDYEKATYHLPSGDITQYVFIYDDYVAYSFDNTKTDNNYNQRNYFVSTDLTDNIFYNYHTVDYFIDVEDYVFTPPLIINNEQVFEGTTVLIQNQGLFEYKNNILNEILTNYSEFKAHIRYGSYANTDVMIETDNNGISSNTTRFVSNKNYIIRNKAEYTLPKDLNFNKTVSYNTTKYSYLSDSDDYTLNRIVDGITTFVISPDYTELVSTRNDISTKYDLSGIANKKIFVSNSKKYVLVYNTLYTLNTSDIYNISKTTVHIFENNILDISYYNNKLYILYSNNIIVFDLDTNTIINTINNIPDSVFAIEYTSGGFYATTISTVYDLNINGILLEHHHKITDLTAYGDVFMITNIYGEKFAYNKGTLPVYTTINDTEQYDFTYIDKTKRGRFSIINNKLEIANHMNNMIYLDGISDYVSINEFDIKKLDISFTFKLDGNIQDNSDIFYLGDTRVNNILPKSYLKLNIKDTSNGNKMVLQYKNISDNISIPSIIIQPDTEYEIRIVTQKTSSKYIFELIINDISYKNDILFRDTTDIINTKCLLGTSEVSNNFVKCYIKPGTDKYVVYNITNSDVISTISKPHKIVGDGDGFNYIVNENLDTLKYDVDISSLPNYGIFESKPCLNVTNNTSVTIDLPNTTYINNDTYKITITYYTDANSSIPGVLDNTIFIQNDLLTLDSNNSVIATSVENFNTDTNSIIVSFDNKQYQTVLYIYSINIELVRNTPYFNVYRVNELSNRYNIIDNSIIRNFIDITIDVVTNKIYMISDDTLKTPTSSIPLNNVYNGVVVYDDEVYFYDNDTIYDISENVLFSTYNITNIDITDKAFYIYDALSGYKNIINRTSGDVYHINIFDTRNNSIEEYNYVYGTDMLTMDSNGDIRLYDTTNNTKYTRIDSDIIYNDLATKTPVFAIYNTLIYLVLDNKMVIMKKTNDKIINYEYANIILDTNINDISIDYIFIDDTYLILGNTLENKFYISNIDYNQNAFYYNVTSDYTENITRYSHIGDNSVVFLDGVYYPNISRNSLRDAAYIPKTQSLVGMYDYLDTESMIMVGDYGTILKYDLVYGKSEFVKTNIPVFTRLNSVISTIDKTIIVGNDATILYSSDNLNFVVYIGSDISLNYNDATIDENGLLYITTDYGNILVYKITDIIEYVDTIYPLDKNETHSYESIISYKDSFIYVSDKNTILYKNNSYKIDGGDIILDVALATRVEDISNIDMVYVLTKKGIYSLNINDKDARYIFIDTNTVYNSLSISLSISSSLRFAGDGLTFEMGNKQNDLSTKNILFTDYNLARKSYILNKDKTPKIAKGSLNKPNNCYFFEADDTFEFSDKNISNEIYNYTAYQDFYYLNSRTINTPGSIGEFENGFRKYNKSLLCVNNYNTKYTMNVNDYKITNSDISLNNINTYRIDNTTSALSLVSTNIINNKYIYILAVADNSIFSKGDFIEVNNFIYLVDSKSSDTTGNNYIKFIGDDNLSVTNYTGAVNLVVSDFIDNTNVMDVISVKVVSNVKNRDIVEGDRLNLNIYLSDIDLIIDSESDVMFDISNNLYSVEFDLKTTVIKYEFEKMTIQQFSDNFRQYKLLSDYIDYTLSTRNASSVQQETKVIEHKFETLDFVSTINVNDMIFINNLYYILSDSHIHIYDRNKVNKGVYNTHSVYKYLTYNKKYNAIYLTGSAKIGVYDLAINKVIYSDDLVCDTAFYNETNGYVYVNNISTNTTYIYDYKSQISNNSMVVFAINKNVLYYYDYSSSAIYDINNTLLVSSDEPKGIVGNYIYTNTLLIDISTFVKTTVIKPHLVEINQDMLISSDKTIYLNSNSVDVLDEIKDIVYTDYIYVLTSSYISCYDISLNKVAEYFLIDNTNRMKTIYGETFLFTESSNNFISLVVEIVEPRNASVNINSLVLDETYVVMDISNNKITLNENFTDDVLYDLNNVNNYVYIKNINNFSTDMMSLKMNYDKHLLKEAFNMNFNNFNSIDISSNITDYNRYFNLETRVLFNNTQVDVAYNDIYGMNYTLLGILPGMDSYQFDSMTFEETYTKTLSMNNQFSIYKNTIVVSENIVNNLHLQKNLFVDITDGVSNLQQVYISKVEKILYTGKTTYYYVISTNRDLSKLVGNTITIRVRDILHEVSDDLKYTDTTMYNIENKYVTNYLENIDMSRYHDIIKNDISIRDYTSAWVGFDKDNVLVMDIHNVADDISLNYRPVEILQMGSDKNLKKAVNVEYTNYDISSKWFGLKNIDINLFNYILMDGLTVAMLEDKYEWVLNAYLRDAIIGIDTTTDDIAWYKGNFLEGDFVSGIWYSGYATNMIFNNGVVNANRVEYLSNLITITETDISKTIFKNCVFDNGIFNNGYMYESTFKNGIFNNGTMSGDFIKGDFNNGNFIGGTFTGNFLGGVFNSTRYNSVFENGIFSGIFGNGIFKNGVLKDAVFGSNSSSYKNAIMEYGYIINSTITCGTKNHNIDTIINNANIESVVVNGGVIKYSNWNNGTMNAGVFDTDNEIVDISIRNDIASLTNTFVNITLEKPHYYKHLKYKNKDVPNYISIMGVPRIYNGKIDNTTLSLGYNKDVKQHFIVEIVDEYTVTIELEKEFPYNETSYTYIPYKSLSVNDIINSGTNNISGGIINNKLYIRSTNDSSVVNELNIINPNISYITDNKYCVDPNTNDIYDISNNGSILTLNKNGVSYLTFPEHGYEIFYNSFVNKIVIVASKLVFIIDSTGYTFIQHSTLPQVCSNIYMFSDNVVFDTASSKMIRVNLNTSIKTVINANTSLRLFKNIISNKAYYIDNGDGYIYDFTANTYTQIMDSVGQKSTIKSLNSNNLFINNNNIYDLNDLSVVECTIPGITSIIDITVMYDNRYLCITTNITNNIVVYELDETFSLTNVVYDIPNSDIIGFVGRDNDTFNYILAESNIYLISTLKSTDCTDYMLPYQPSTPVTDVKPVVMDTYYIGGIKLASYWNAGTFNRGVFKYGYFKSGNFHKGLFRDGVINTCNFGYKK